MARYSDDSDYDASDRLLSDPVGDFFGNLFVNLLIHCAWLALAAFLVMSPWMIWTGAREKNLSDFGYGVLGLVWSTGCLVWWYMEASAYFLLLAQRMLGFTAVLGIIASVIYWLEKRASTKRKSISTSSNGSPPRQGGRRAR